MLSTRALQLFTICATATLRRLRWPRRFIAAPAFPPMKRLWTWLSPSWSRPGWGARSSYLHVKANWQLIVDNLLDLTHLAFVHETTIGNSALVDNASVKVTRGPAEVQVTRWIIDAPAPPTFAATDRLMTNASLMPQFNTPSLYSGVEMPPPDTLVE